MTEQKEQPKLKTNHNVRVVTLTTAERVLCLFGALKDEEDKINGYRMIYPYILTLGQTKDDGSLPINYTRFNPFSPFEEHLISGDHIISVVLPDAQIFENYVEKLHEVGMTDEAIYYPEGAKDGSESESNQTAA